MDKREKVIKGLECCLAVTKCGTCPYNTENDLWCGNNNPLFEDALALLKAQEPRVMTAEDMWTLKFNDTVILEQKIPPLLIPAIVRDNIKHDDALEVLQVVTKELLTDRRNGDFDTKAILTLKSPEGTVEQINRYYAEGETGWTEIDLIEYGRREDADKHRREQEARDSG